MRRYVFYLWIIFLFEISFSYASDMIEDVQDHKFHQILQNHINSTLELYKKNIQSEKYPFGTFSQVYDCTILALQETITNTIEFFEEYRLNSFKNDDDLAREELPAASSGSASLANEPINNFIEDPFPQTTSLIIQAKNLRHNLRKIPSEIYIDLKISQGKIGKLCKKLLKNAEMVENFESTFLYVSDFFHTILPNYSQETYNKAIQPYIALFEWREKSCKTSSHKKLNAFFNKDFIQGFLESIHQTGRINLISFICPPIDFEKLISQNPENYFLTTAENSSISKHILYFKSLIERFLIPTGIAVRVTFMIGDSDEDDYIWGENNLKPLTLNEKELDSHRLKLCANIAAYVSSFLPSAQIDVQSLHQHRGKNADINAYEELFTHYSEYFSPSDIDTEKKRMLELWKKGNYYNGLSYPGDFSLSFIIRAKLGSYAVHGLTAHKLEPTAILCQTEFPLELRTKMLNSGRKYRDKGEFPTLYLFG